MSPPGDKAFGSTNTPLTLTALERFDRDRFTNAIGFVFEDSPWVAEQAWETRPFGTVSALHAALCRAVQEAPLELQLALVNAHPDLAGKRMREGGVSPASDAEQRAASLDRLAQDERGRLLALAAAYRERFGFPCVICVRNHPGVKSIADEIERRTEGRVGAELDASVREVFEIARRRLADTVEGGLEADRSEATGCLTSHVLDTARGRPAAGMSLELLRHERPGWTRLTARTTNSDGRTDEPLLAGDDFLPGRYELRFDVRRYFASVGVPTSSPPFLGEVPVQFAIVSDDEHHHVPLIVSPWGYSTYRGS